LIETAARQSADSCLCACISMSVSPCFSTMHVNLSACLAAYTLCRETSMAES
jgi:hypothetical protein